MSKTKNLIFYSEITVHNLKKTNKCLLNKSVVWSSLFSFFPPSYMQIFTKWMGASYEIHPLRLTFGKFVRSRSWRFSSCLTCMVTTPRDCLHHGEESSTAHLSLQSKAPIPRGYSHIGMCRFNGSLFHKKSLNMGPIFYKNIPKHRSVFTKYPIYFRACEYLKILKNGPVFQEKSLKWIPYLFLPKWPLKMDMGFEARAAHPRPNQIWVPMGSHHPIKKTVWKTFFRSHRPPDTVLCIH